VRSTLVPAAVITVFLCSCVSRETEKIAPGWFVVTERSPIPEAGGYHPLLWRKSTRVPVMVDTDTYSVTNLRDDCVAWYGLDSRGLFVACGDHEPLLLQRDPKTQTGITVSGDQLSLGSFVTSVRAAKELARRQATLTPAWRAGNLR